MKKLLKFSADWCGPCHAVAPQLEKVANDFNLEVEIIDIDDNPGLAQEYGVSSVPTILLIEEGKELARHIGAAPKSLIASNLGLKA